MSGIVTNQRTCLDALTEASFLQCGHKLYAPLMNGSQLYSVSLAMLTNSWAFKHKNANPGRQLLDGTRVGKDGVPHWVNRKIFLSGSGRRMALQTAGSVVVAHDGSGNYRTIGDAIAAAPANDGSKGYYVINVKAGVYQEYVTIPKAKRYIMMVGDGIGNTIITGSRNVVDAVLGDGFVAIGITVRNTASPAKHQAVAVRNGADLSTFYKCSFEGYQDTLYTYSMRQFFRECDIYGTVDFIFGNAAVVFQNCNIYVRLPSSGQFNTVTAQGRSDPNQNTGTSIINCNVAATSDLAGHSNVNTYLGRPWRQYSRTVFMQSNLGSLINPAGWTPWSGSFALSTLYYGEYNNRGPGAATGGRVKWAGFHSMSSSDASRFTVSSFIQGGNWLPKTTLANKGSNQMERSARSSAMSFFPIFFFFTLALLFPSSISLIDPVTPDHACTLTTDPQFCQSLLPSASLSNFYGYGQYLIKKSLQQSYAFSSLINETIRDKAALTPQAAAALNDCLLLSELTTDFLTSSLSTLDSCDATSLAEDQADLVQTLLSGIVTNRRTCLDGLTQASFLQHGHKLYAPLMNGSQLYSVSLAMLTNSWAFKHRKANPGRQLLDEMRVGKDGVPEWVNRKIFRAGSVRRMALQTVGSVVVAKDGSGKYRTIGEAIAAAPANSGSNGYYVINVKAGVYEEYVTIPKNKKYIMMVGDGIGKTIITGHRNVVDGSTTFNSATLAVLGEGFVAIGITVRNTAGPAKHQAVAVRNGADLSTFYKCSFEGYQDTLYTYSMRQFFRECDIYGTVDFIFGNAAVVFQNCNIYVRLPAAKQFNTVTAQGRTDPNQNTGISIINCNIAATSDLAGHSEVRTYLGRPWKQYSRTVFIQSNLGSLINPAGWSPWAGSFALSTLYYGEYSNRGPGAATGGRVKWPGFHIMSANEASRFTVSSFIQGGNWLPKTTVPFTA
ncbi:putative pectinesterase/pectinesterase inhibitor 41 [Nymphaea thermarum]|nr:putative pectinesterase/pectinesterase inhibitor 41 [Nymphaea thermarum]